jgi:hypothetical protein
MSDSVIITAMVLSTVILLSLFFGTMLFLHDRNERDGTYGLDRAKNKAKADLIENETTLKLVASRKEPEYENVLVEHDTRD